jgi:hypothetical protein
MAVARGQFDEIDEGNIVFENDGPSGAWEVASPIAGATDSVIASTCMKLGCVAIDASGVAWAFDVSWSPRGGSYSPRSLGHLGPTQPSDYVPAGGMSCDPLGSFCLVLAGYVRGGPWPPAPAAKVFADVNTGRWGLQYFQRMATIKDENTPPYVDGPPLDPSCGARGICMAIPATSGYNLSPDRGWVWRTIDMGRSWRRLRLATGDPIAISCASAQSCAVGTSGGVVEFTRDGGRHWAVRHVPGWTAFAPQPQPVTGLSCWSSRGCVASTSGIGSSNGGPFPSGGIMETLDGGKSWTAISVPAVLIEGVSCAGPHNCWAYGASNVFPSHPVMIHWG